MGIERGLLLFRQRRYDLAAEEFRAALAREPDLAQGHAFLALCLIEQEQFQDATREAKQAVALAPALPVAHAVLARVYARRNYYKLAEESVLEAVALDPYEPDHHALLGAIRMDRRDWRGALEAAEAALAADPEHVQGNNVRAMALVQLGRRADAGRTIAATLARDPEDAFTHANQGWALLHGNQPQKAMEHFREALRLDPANDWARQGIMEALKAKNLIYRAVLMYFLWMSRRSGKVMWAVLIGLWLVMNVVIRIADKNPQAKPWLQPLIYGYILFVLLTWLAYPLFNLMLRVNKFGRLALSREQVVASNWVGGVLLAAAMMFLAGLVLGDVRLRVGGASMLVFAVPVAGAFYCPKGWPRKLMGIYAIALGVLGLTVHLLATPRDGGLFLGPRGGMLYDSFLVANFVGSILTVALMSYKPKR